MTPPSMYLLLGMTLSLSIVRTTTGTIAFISFNVKSRSDCNHHHHPTSKYLIQHDNKITAATTISTAAINSRTPQTKAQTKLYFSGWKANEGPSYCEKCGQPTIIRKPPNDERDRSCCSDPSCGYVSYQNPKIVVGAICTYNKKVLLCRRAIEPCMGKWGYPQGFLEIGETTRVGAARETVEEAGATFDPSKADLLAVYNLAGYQVQMIYFVELPNDDIEAGIESSDVDFFEWDDIPWEDLAFPTVGWALEYARDNVIGSDGDTTKFAVQERTKYVDEDGVWRVEEG